MKILKIMWFPVSHNNKSKGDLLIDENLHAMKQFRLAIFRDHELSFDLDLKPVQALP